MNILSVKNKVWTRKHEIYPELDKELNQIQVTFDVAPSKKIRIHVEKVMLQNEKGVPVAYTGAKNFCGIINMPVLTVCFDMDECLLLNGAKFAIVLRGEDKCTFEKHEFVLHDDKWIETVQ